MTIRHSEFPHRPTEISRGSLGAAASEDRAVGQARPVNLRVSKLLGAVVALALIGIVLLPLAGGLSSQQWRQLERDVLAFFEPDAQPPNPDARSSAQPTDNGAPDSQALEPWHDHLNRALAAADGGRDDEAEVHFLNALFEVEKFNEPDSRITNVLDNVGFFYDRRQRYEEAIPFYVRAVAGYQATVGVKNEPFIAVERRLAYAYRAQKSFTQALAHLNSAIDAARALHGPGYVGIAYGYQETGDIRLLTGDATGAMKDYRRALEVAEGLGADHQLVRQLEQALSKGS